MLRYNHLRLDQDKIERAKKILRAKTETEAMDKALEKVIEEDRERLRRRGLLKRIIELPDPFYLLDSKCPQCCH